MVNTICLLEDQMSSYTVTPRKNRYLGLPKIDSYNKAFASSAALCMYFKGISLPYPNSLKMLDEEPVFFERMDMMSTRISNLLSKLS